MIGVVFFLFPRNLICWIQLWGYFEKILLYFLSHFPDGTCYFPPYFPFIFSLIHKFSNLLFIMIYQVSILILNDWTTNMKKCKIFEWNHLQCCLYWFFLLPYLCIKSHIISSIFLMKQWKKKYRLTGLWPKHNASFLLPTCYL